MTEERYPKCPSVNQQDDAYTVELDIDDDKGVIVINSISVICDYHDVDENDDDDED